MILHIFRRKVNGENKKRRTGRNRGRKLLMKEMNYVYLVRCADGSLYCGWTTDLSARMEAHNSGKGAKYTRSRLPVKLVWWEAYEDRHAALSREWHIKQMRRDQKEALAGILPEELP